MMRSLHQSDTFHKYNLDHLKHLTLPYSQKSLSNIVFRLTSLWIYVSRVYKYIYYTSSCSSFAIEVE